MNMEISESLYKIALARIEELLPQVTEDTPIDDSKSIELCHFSDLVEAYEKEHFPMETPSFSSAIETRLKEERMAKKTLASRIGVSPSRISDFLSGKAEPSLSQAREICKVLKIEPSLALGM